MTSSTGEAMRAQDGDAPETAEGEALDPKRVLAGLAVLEQAPLLFLLGDRQLRRLARRLNPLEVEAGARLAEQGGHGTCLYLIEEGSCEVAVEPEPGHFIPIARVGDGDLVGEAIVTGEASAVTVTATTACRLLALDRASLLAVVGEGTPLHQELSQQVERRQRTNREVAARAGGLTRAGDAPVTAFYAPKGGSGETTITLNLAAQLAEGAGDVLVLDLDLPHNQAALLSGLVPTGSLARGANRPQHDLEETLLSAAQLHHSGYMVLPGALRPEESDLIDADLVRRGIGAVRGSFGNVLVDLGAQLSEVALTVLDLAERVVLVVTPELPSLKGAKDVLHILHEVLHLPEERITLVFNHRQANAVIPRETFERLLGRAPDLEIGHDGNKPERAALEGTVVAVSDPRSEVARATRTLAGRVTGEAAPEPGRRRGRLGRRR